MNPVFQWRDQVARVSSWLVEEFDGLYAAIQTGWNREHNLDGTHGAITTTGLAATGLATVPRLGFRPAPLTPLTGNTSGVIVSPDIGTSIVSTPWEFPYVDQAGVILVTHQGARLDGLSVRGREVGDMVALVNFQGNNADLTLRLRSATLLNADGYFAGNLSLPNVDVSLTRGRWVWLMLLNAPGATRRVWHLHHF